MKIADRGMNNLDFANFFSSQKRAGRGAEIAKPDNAAPDETDRNGLNIRRPKKNRTCWTIEAN